MRIESSVLYDVIPRFLRDGWQVVSRHTFSFELTLIPAQNVHAIGDRANGIILDVFESSLKGVNVTALRPRLEHAQMMTVADMRRLGKLGGQSCFRFCLRHFLLTRSRTVIASVQPTHA